MEDIHKWLIIIFIWAIPSCSSTHIHLHADKLPHDQQITIRERLEEKGFKVHIRNNAPPSRDNVLLYYPHKGIQEELWMIDDVLAASGISAEHRYTIYKDRVGKHEYTAGNIGLYLLPRNSDWSTSNKSPLRKQFPISESDAEFISSDCDARYTLELLEDGNALINNYNLPTDESTLGKGTWQSNSDQILLTFQGEAFKYDKSQHHRKAVNYANERVIQYHITLEPSDYYRIPFSCTFQSTFTEAY